MYRSRTRIGTWWRRTRSAALDLAFPPRCGACGGDAAELAGAAMICSPCREELRLIDWPVCERCAAPIPEANGAQLVCNTCRGVRLRFDRTIALGSYEGLLR